MIGIGEPDTIFRYRMIEERWWKSWSAKEDGYLGCYTRTHGWRFLKVRLASDPKTVMTLDPQAMDSNFMQWDVNCVSAAPYWRKRQETATWANDGIGDGGIPHTPWDELEELIEDIIEGLLPGISDLIPGMHIGEGNIVIPNRGSETAFAKFLVSSPGRAWIQDGPGGPMIKLPLLTPADGTVLVDTDPTARPRRRNRPHRPTVLPHRKKLRATRVLPPRHHRHRAPRLATLQRPLHHTVARENRQPNQSQTQ
jgi:hypothetical protein